ncbi:MAG: hypothetical protein R2820_06745 [Cyclobacteriaceae bacterium]|nr:hypothetical protein [Cyclobacteriaceae bacterium]
MIPKIFKAVWFLSLIGFMMIFMYVYASLPENVVFSDATDAVVASRDLVFYLSVTVVAVVNALVFVVSKLYKRSDGTFSAWFYGQIILLNFFFCTVVGFVYLLNSGEKFSYDRLGIVIYGSISLIVLWSIGLPIYQISRRFSSKQAI